MQPARFFLRGLGQRSLLFSSRFQGALLKSPRKFISDNAPRRTSGPSGSQTGTISQQSTSKGKEKEILGDRDKVVEAMEEEQDRLPFLPHPLGVREPPTTEPKSWRDEMMNQEVRMDHRRKL